MPSLTFRIDTKLLKLVEKVAEKEQRPLSQVVRLALEAYLKAKR
jgi:predicted transcriptional regulator